MAIETDDIDEVSIGCLGKNHPTCPNVAVVEGFANGDPVKILLDSGSEVNVIQSDLVERLNLKPMRAKENIIARMANKSEELWTHYVNVTLRVGNRASDLNLYIAKKLDFPVIIRNNDIKLLGYALVRINNIKDPFQEKSKEKVHEIYSINDVEKYYPLCLQPKKEPKIKVPFQLKEGCKIVSKKPYRLSPEKLQWAKKKVAELLERNIIRHSTSKFATPVIPLKENGELRFCQDYRMINQEMELIHFHFQ